MARRLTWLKWLFISAGLLALAAIVCYVGFLPMIAKAQVARAFTAMGTSPASFQLRSVSLSEIELTAVRFGNPEWGGIETVSVSYSIQSLWEGRIKTIQLDQVQWRIKIDEGKVDFGPRFIAAADPAKDVPFDRLIAPHLSLVVEQDGREINLTADATITRTAAGMLELKMDANWPDLDAAVFARGRLDLTSGAPNGEFTAIVPPIELTDDSPLIGFAPLLSDMNIGGTFAFDARFQLIAGEISPLVKITASNVSIERPDWPIAVDSAAATITINSLDPITTLPGQKIALQKARIGELEVSEGTIQFELAADDRISIEQAAWSMGQYGRFAAAPFSVNLADPQLATSLVGENINLGDWLNLLTNGRAKGEGLLQGTVELSIAFGEGNIIQIGEGILQAQRDGWVQVADADLVTQMLDQTQPASITAAQWQQTKSKMREALRDYQYSMLRIDFLPEDQDVLARIQTSGQGRKGPDPLQFGLLTVNIHNFNVVLNNALRLRSALQRME